MKIGRRAVICGFYMLLGATLMALGMAEVIDAFWSGMGGGLLGVGIVRLVQMYRLKKDDTYREKMETEVKDERNAFIRNKAWAWAGYLFILIAAVAVIVLQVMGQEQLSMLASGALCLMLVLYWVSYLILRKKY